MMTTTRKQSSGQ